MDIESTLIQDFATKQTSKLNRQISQAIQKKGYDPNDLEMLQNAGRIGDLKGVKTLFINDEPICCWYNSEFKIITEGDTVKAISEIHFKEL